MSGSSCHLEVMSFGDRTNVYFMRNWLSDSVLNRGTLNWDSCLAIKLTSLDEYDLLEGAELVLGKN